MPKSDFEVDGSPWVYHYTSWATAHDHILASSKIKLGPLDQTNDPRERGSFSFGTELIDSVGVHSGDYDLMYKLACQIKRNCKVLCMTTDDIAPMHGLLANLMAGDPFGGLASDLERGYARSRNWAQYADNHRGVCLVFDREKLHDEIRSTFEDKYGIYRNRVTYSDDVKQLEAFKVDENRAREMGSSRFIEVVREENWQTFFFTKLKDWSSELEYRWLLIGKDNEPEYVSIQSSLAGVVAGSDCLSSDKTNLERLCEKLQVPFAELTWRNGFPFLRQKNSGGTGRAGIFGII